MSEDKQNVIDILMDSFFQNEASSSVVIQDKKKKSRFELLLKYSYFYANKFGRIYLDKDREACALIIDDNKKGYRIELVWWYTILFFKVFGISRSGSILKRLKRINDKRPKGSIYIWYIGVSTKAQGNGVGSDLLNKIIEDYAERKIVLETTNCRNFNFYENAGFQKYNQLNVEGFEFYFYQLN